MKRRVFITRNKNHASKNEKSFYYFINISFILLILIASSGVLAFNSSLQTMYRNISNDFQTKKDTPMTPRTHIDVQPISTPLTTNQTEMNILPLPINYFALGEKSLFGASTTALTTNTLILPRTTNVGESKFSRGIKNVFVIVMENSNWTDIQGNINSAPYINEKLLPQASYANNYYNPIDIHPSEPNYIWLEAGSNTNIGGRRFNTDDDPSFINSSDTTAHLTTLLNQKNISWKTYLEDIDGTTCPTTSNGLYAAKHNPMVFFQDVSANTSYCIAHERPMSEFATDLHSKHTAQYNLIIPNLCNDMHNDCDPIHNTIKQGDTWLSHVIPQILDSQGYRDGGLIFITWDEGENKVDGPIGLIALSKFAMGNGYTSDMYYTHSSLLRTIEEIFGLPYLRDSANARDLHDLFVETSPDVSLTNSFTASPH